MAKQQQTAPLTRPCMARNQAQHRGSLFSSLAGGALTGCLQQLSERQCKINRRLPAFHPSPTRISKGKLDFPPKCFKFPEQENKTLPVMNGGWQLVGIGTALPAVGNRPKTFRHRKETKKLMGRMPIDGQGGPKPLFFFTEICQQRSAGKQATVHPARQLSSKTIAPRIVLAVCYPA